MSDLIRDTQRFFVTATPDRLRDRAIAALPDANACLIVAAYLTPYADPERERAAHRRLTAAVLIERLTLLGASTP